MSEGKILVNGKEEFDLKGFVYDDMMKECGRYELPKQILYLKYALHIWNNDRPRFDPNGTLVPSMEERLKREIEKREDINKLNISEIDQDSIIEKFKKSCVDRKLVKGKSIPNAILYEIAEECGMLDCDFEDFKAGNTSYHRAREYASRLNYKRRKPSERE